MIKLLEIFLALIFAVYFISCLVVLGYGVIRYYWD
jgi:hypothetical protein